MVSFESRLKSQANALGFEAVGIAPASEADGFLHLQDWLAQGFAGDMQYLSRHAEARRHPGSILPNVKTVVMVGINYKPEDSGSQIKEAADSGRVSCYARGLDYHDVMRSKLKSLLAWVQREAPHTQGRAVVDTAPLLERDFARRAGLGWIGKNTMLIHRTLGSYLFLGALLLDLPLGVDEPFSTSHCGTCTRCLDACPTNAFVAPFRLDARRCISYLTIELRGAIPEDLRPQMSDWIFGCDVCQQVCPWNRKPPAGTDESLKPNVTGQFLDAAQLLGMNEAEFRKQFRHTPLWRSGRGGLLRNAAIALGNCGNSDALPALERAREDSDPQVREAAVWAIARIHERQALCAT